MSAMRTPPIGPENGRPESCVEMDAALIASVAYESSGCSELDLGTLHGCPPLHRGVRSLCRSSIEAHGVLLRRSLPRTRRRDGRGVLCSCPTHVSPDPRARAWSGSSAAQAEPLDEAAVAVDVDLLKVAEQPTALADQEQQATTRVVVVLVHLQVLGEVLDARAEHRDLDLRGAGVTLMGGVLGHDGLLRGGVEGHDSPWLSHCAAHRGLSTRALSVRGRSDGLMMLSVGIGGAQSWSRYAEPVVALLDVGPHLVDQSAHRVES